MKHIRLWNAAALAVVLALIACKNDPKTPTEPTAAAPATDTIVMYTPPSAEGATAYTVTWGEVIWTGGKKIGKANAGTFNVEGGELLVNNGQLVNGTVSIDMSTLKCVNLKSPDKEKLEEDLRKNFFHVDKYPKSSYTFKEATPLKDLPFDVMVEGDLTMHGKTGRVNIPSKVKMEGTELYVESTPFLIDRTEWDINMMSEKFGAIKDQIVDDRVRLVIRLKAKPKS